MRLQTIKNITIGLFITFIVLSIGFFLLNESPLFCLDCKIHSLKFSQFGGFFSGILSSLSIFLLVLTFFFNKESREIAQIEKYYENISKDIDHALFDGKRGIEAYLNYRLDTDIKNNLLDNINLVLKNFEMYIELIEKNKIIIEVKKMDFENVISNLKTNIYTLQWDIPQIRDETVRRE